MPELKHAFGNHEIRLVAHQITVHNTRIIVAQAAESHSTTPVSMSMVVDIFSSAIGDDLDEWGDDVVPVLGGPVQSGDVLVCAKRKQTIGKTDKKAVGRPKGKSSGYKRATSLLSIVDPSAGDSRWPTIFIEKDADHKKESASKKVPNVNYMPITLWPQYSCKGTAGTYVIVGASEKWLGDMVHTLRPKTTSSVSAKVGREMDRQICSFAKSVLRKLLGKTDSANSKTDMDDDSDDDTPRKRRKGMSGFAIKDILIIDGEFEGHCLTVVNYGGRLVLQVNDALLPFINTVLRAFLTKLAVADAIEQPAVADASVEKASFRFEDDTPNINGKVKWNSTNNEWHVLLQQIKGAASVRNTDKDGVPLRVPEGLSASDNMMIKHKHYAVAIATWNEMDTSNRYRILPPPIMKPSTVPRTPSTDAPSDSQHSLSAEIEEAELFDGCTLSLHEKWAEDAAASL